jgi:PAS domain S-box-containing protein
MGLLKQIWNTAKGAPKEPRALVEMEANFHEMIARFREQSDLLELIHDAIFVRSLKNEIQYWNRSAERLYGWSKEEVQGRTTHELLQTQFPRDLASIEATLFEKGYWEGELQHHTHDGRIVSVSSRWALHTSRDGNVIGVLESNRDLTELKSDERRFQNLLEAAPDAIVIVNGSGRIEIVNAQTERLFGYPRGELLGLPVEILVPDRFHGKHAHHRHSYAHSPKPRAMGAGLDLYGRHRDGTEFPVEISLSPIETRQGTLISSAIRDVSERKQFELKLRESEQRFRVLVEGVKDYAIIGLDPIGRVTTWNAGAERFRGFAADEILGQNFSRFFSPEDVAAGRPDKLLQQAIEKGSVEHEGWSLRKNGTQFWADVVIAAVRDEAGDLTGFSKIARDTTEKRILEQELRNANEFLEQRVAARTAELATANAELLDAQELLRMTHKVANIGTFDIDHKTGRVSWSLEMQELYGLKPGEFDGSVKTWRSLIHPDDLARAESACEEGEETKFALHAEFRTSRPDRQLRWIASRAKPLLNAAGEIERMVGVNLDITEQRAKQDEISALNATLEQRVEERTAELIRANDELESFSYSVSHDLRAPLRHIDGFARILREEFSSELPEEGLHYLGRICQSATHMGQLVDDLLALARIGRKEVSRQTVNTTNLVKECIADLRLEAEREIQWRVENLEQMHCDPGLTKLVFTNLLSNAAKFTRNCPAAIIEVGCCDIDSVPTLFVRDNGVGFDPQYADKLFGVFQRLHRQEDFEGTGIGLATVQRIVHRHGGRIWAESSPGQGATFFFTLDARVSLPTVLETPEIKHD